MEWKRRGRRKRWRVNKAKEREGGIRVGIREGWKREKQVEKEKQHESRQM